VRPLQLRRYKIDILFKQILFISNFVKQKSQISQRICIKLVKNV